MFKATGKLLNSGENQKLRKRLRSARDANVALNEERVRFAVQTGATVSSEAPVEAIAEALGALSIAQVTLRTVATDSESSYGAVWEMKAIARKAASPERPYTLQFEPYGGRLVGVKHQ